MKLIIYMDRSQQGFLHSTGQIMLPCGQFLITYFFHIPLDT